MRRTLSILTLLCAAALLQGCGTGSFLGQRYDNFTAYYNTFYNAERVFEQGYEGVGQGDERIDRTEFLPVFVRPRGGSRGGEFESAIEKSADVLRDHPDSKWVDDALLLIGKSYFYRENFVGAIQKFREVVSLGTGREAEGRFWLARTLIISGAFEEAEAELLAALAEEGLDRRWAARYRLALGELNVIEEDWEAAASELSTGLDDINDDDLAARAWFTLGQVYEKLEQYDEAAEAYGSVRKHSPPYELSYAASYSATRVEGFHGDLDEALSRVRKLERDDKNLEYQSEIRLLRARILQQRGRDDEAFAIYSDLLYNPNRDMTLPGLRGRVHYSLGELYRDVDGDYVLAAAHFDTARTSLSGGSRRQAASSDSQRGRARAPEAIEDLDLLVESYNAYADAFSEVARLDSLLHLGSLSQEEFEERILELRKMRAEELERQRKLLEEMQRNQQFNRQSGEDAFRNAGNAGLPQGKTIPDLEQLRGQNQSSDAGFLGVEDPIRVQEGRVSFVSRWGERPLVPNWRREAALSNAEIAEDSGLQEAAGPLTDEEGPDELPEIDISAVPRDSTARMNMLRDRALARYELGNTLFLGMNRPDSAAAWYRRVLDEGDSTDVSQRALYALAEVQYSLGDTTSATRLYRDILDRYPDSDFSDNVRERLGMEREVLSADSVSVALATYGEAFARWDSSGTRLSSRRAFNEMLRIAGTWPHTGAGARSLLSAAEIHLDMAGADSAAIFGPLPITVDDSEIEAVWPAKAKALQGQAGAASQPAAPTRESAADTTLSDTAVADSAFAASVTAGSDAGARVSPFGHVAITDSLVLAVMPPGGVGQADALVPAIRQIRVDDGGAFLQTQQPGILASELRIHDLLEAVGRLHPRTPFATRAQLLTGLLDELLIVEVREDSTAADSLASDDSGGPPVAGVVAGDSLGLTVPTDSVAIVNPDSAGVIVADSTRAALDPADSAVERLRTREDSLAAAELSGKQRFVPRTPAPTPAPSPEPDDTLQVTPGAAVNNQALEIRDDVDRFEPDIDTPEAILEREKTDSGEPDFVADPSDADDAALDDLPSGLIVDPAELEEEGIRSSSSLRPLASDGEADEAAVGWTAVFQTSRDMATAQLERRRFKVMLGEQGDALRLLVHTRSDEPEVIVAWGLFDTRAELQVALDIARRDAGDSFPDDPQMIVLIP